MELMNGLDAKEWLSYNAKLQAKKNALRADLADRGMQKNEGNNTYDKYKYFTEGQYKLLFTELFSKHKLELHFDELEYTAFEGPEKQANGRMVRIRFTLTDVETGFSEDTTITGEGIDKGDKAGYKAYTGALKYYLADTFMVATDDDPESESPDQPMNNVNRAPQAKPAQTKPAQTQAAPKTQAPAPQKSGEPLITEAQVRTLSKTYTGDLLAKLLEKNGLARLEDMTKAKASELIAALIERDKKKKAEAEKAQAQQPAPTPADDELPFDLTENGGSK